MTTVHCLTGYDRRTEVQKFWAPIPEERFASIQQFIHFNPEDPDAIFSYELTYPQAMEIASMIKKSVGLSSGLEWPLSADLAFYLEACSEDD
jgi:hypothetical protein